jgi:hypothetical protein
MQRIQLTCFQVFQVFHINLIYHAAEMSTTLKGKHWVYAVILPI